MFALLGLSGGEIILLLVVGLVLLGGLATVVGLVLYFVLRQKKSDGLAKPPTLPGK